MPTITIILSVQSAADEAELYDAFAAQYRRPDEVDNPAFVSTENESPTNRRKVPNPETRQEHFTRKVKQYIEEVWGADLAEKARKQAESSRKKPKIA